MVYPIYGDDWGMVFTLGFTTFFGGSRLEVLCQLLLKMAIEIVDFPIKNGDFP